MTTRVRGKRTEVDITRVDNAEIDGGVPVMDFEHFEIHEGDHYFCTGYATKNAAEVYEVLLTTPATPEIHFRGRVNFTHVTTIQFFETSTRTGGTAITPINNLRSSSNTSTLTVAHTPGGSGDGTAIWQGIFGSSTGVNGVGGTATQADEIILKPSTKYLLKVTSGTNGNNIAAYLAWYEHTRSF